MSVQGVDRNGRHRVQCSAVRNSGTCTHSRKYYADVIAKIVMQGMRQHLAHPEAIREFVDTYHRQRSERTKSERFARTRFENQLATVKRRIEALITLWRTGSQRLRACAISLWSLSLRTANSRRSWPSCLPSPKQSHCILRPHSTMPILSPSFQTARLERLAPKALLPFESLSPRLPCILHPPARRRRFMSKACFSLLLGTEAPLAGRFGVNGHAGERDSNPHDLRHWNLNPARLPIPPHPRRGGFERPSENGTDSGASQAARSLDSHGCA